MDTFDVQTKTSLDDRTTHATLEANQSKELQLQDKPNHSECVHRPSESKLFSTLGLTHIYTCTYPYQLITGVNIGFVPLLFSFIYIYIPTNKIR